MEPVMMKLLLLFAAIVTTALAGVALAQMSDPTQHRSLPLRMRDAPPPSPEQQMIGGTAVIQFHGTALSLSNGHCGKHVVVDSASPITITVPTAITATSSSSCDVNIMQYGAGVAGIVPGPGVTWISSPLGFTKTSGKGSDITVVFMHDASNTPIFFVSGMGAR
jgi:hypothetical protein